MRRARGVTAARPAGAALFLSAPRCDAGLVGAGDGGKGGAAVTTGPGTKAGERRPGAAGAQPSRAQALRLYKTMLLIRRVEERLRDDSAAGRLPTSIGVTA